MSPYDKELIAAPSLPDSIFEMFSLKGQVALITGASGGIGLAVTRAYAEAGASVAMLFNSTNVEKEAAEIAEQYGVKVVAYKYDGADPDSIDEVFAKVKQEFQFIDIVVANAGGKGVGPINSISNEEYAKYCGLNQHGVFYCARAAGRIWEEQVKQGRGVGRLIITSSMSGIIVNIPLTQAVYNMTKAAVSHLGRSLAYDFREFARVNVVSPGYVNTKMGTDDKGMLDILRIKSCIPRQADAKEMKGIYLYLASNASSYTTGSEFVIDGGYCLP